MTDVRLTRSSEVKIVRAGQIHEHQRILLVVGAAQIELAVEAEENAVVQSVRERGWSKDDVVGPFALLARERVRLRLKGHQGLNALAAHHGPGAIGSVVVRKAKKLDRGATDVGRPNQVEFVCAQWLIRIHQAINPVVLEIQIAGRRMKSETRRIAEATGDSGKISRGDASPAVDQRQHINRVSQKRPAGSRYVCAADGPRAGAGGEVRL